MLLASGTGILAPMDRLWTPWRYEYVTSAEKTPRQGVPKALEAWPGDCHCVFCNMIAAVEFAVAGGMAPEEAERAAGILLRGPRTFLVLNAYPYSSGHLMVVPYLHESSLAALDVATTHELIETAQRVERVLGAVYSPHGFNIGMNLGKAAGAGVEMHLHLHALPRWLGDTNFMTTVGETRVLPETLDVTWARLRGALGS
ncbi:MAG TPA: HIT domain-containing protein [Acidisarcina sp.]